MENTNTPKPATVEDYQAEQPRAGAVAVQNQGTAVAATPEQQMINSIMQIASNPDVDVDKMDKLFSMQERMMDRQNKMDYDEALARVQADMPRITQRGEIKNKNGMVVANYMKYEDIDLEIRPRLQKEGFSLKHDRKHIDGKMVVTTTLKHRSGHEESVEIPLPYDKENALKSALQAAVGTFSVGKRVNVCSLLNIVQEGEDDAARMAEANAISDDQAAHIKSELQRLFEAGADIDTLRLLKFIGAETVEKIPAAKYDDVIKLLKRKEDQMQNGGA